METGVKKTTTPATASSAASTASTPDFAFYGLLVALMVATGLRLFYTFEQKDFIWYDTTQYIAVSQHALLSRAFWSGSQPPLVPLMWKVTESATGFAGLQSILAAIAWGFLAWTVWSWLGGGFRATAAACVVLGFSLTPFVLQWDASDLSETISLAAIAVIFGTGLWLIERFTWGRAAGLIGACLVFELARDEGIEVVGSIGVVAVVVAVAFAVAKRRSLALRYGLLAAIVLATTGLVALAAQQAHRNVLNVENSLFVRVFPYPNMVADFASHGMPQSKQIDAVAKVLAVPQASPYAYASPVPSPSTALVVGPVLSEPYWAPLRHWIAAHGESTYLEFLATHPSYVLRAPLHHPSLAFNSPSTLDYYHIAGHSSIPGMSIFFPRRIFVLAMALIAAATMLIRRVWRRWEVAYLMAMIPLGMFAMAVGWFGDGQEIARHMIEGNVMIRLAVLLLLLWSALSKAVLVGEADVADGDGESVSEVADHQALIGESSTSG